MKKWILAGLAVFLAAALCAAPALAAEPVKDWDGLSAAIAKGETDIALPSELTVDSAITVSGAVTLTAAEDGTTLTIGSTGAFNVNVKGSLTLKGQFTIAASGNKNITASLADVAGEGALHLYAAVQVAEGSKSTVSLIDCAGQLYMYDGAEVSGFTVTGARDGAEIAAIRINGENAGFTMEGGSITGNNNPCGSNYISGGAVLVTEGARFTMEGGSITGNNVGCRLVMGGGVYVRAASFTMNGGEISRNEGSRGAGVYAGCNLTDGTGPSTFVMNGGSITQNVLYNAQSIGNIPSVDTKGGGGGVYVLGGSFEMGGNALISENSGAEVTPSTSAKGGGVYVSALRCSFPGKSYSLGSSVTITGGTISNNVGVSNGGPCGGGLYISGASVSVSGLTVTGNRAFPSEEDTGYNAYGGGLAIDGSEGDVTISGCTFSNNLAMRGGGAYISSSHQVTMENCSIVGNRAQAGDKDNGSHSGGGIYFYGGGSLTLSGCGVSGNSAGSYGGGIYFSGKSAALKIQNNSQVSGNSAGSYGGGIYCNGALEVSGSSITGNSAVEYGGGLISWGSAKISGGSSVTGNEVTDGDGGGMYICGSADILDSTITGNSASGCGGGAASNGTFTLGEGGKLYGNTAQTGGNDFYNGDDGSFTLPSPTTFGLGYDKWYEDAPDARYDPEGGAEGCDSFADCRDVHYLTLGSAAKPVLTITITPMEMTAYTGGNSLSGGSFPEPRYSISVSGGEVGLESIAFSVDGSPVALPEGAAEDGAFPIEWLGAVRTLEGAVRADDRVPGDYIVSVGNADEVSASVNGYDVKLEFISAGLTVRNVSDPEGVIEETADVTRPVVNEAGQVSTAGGVGAALIPAGTQYYTNGREKLGLPAGAQISLLFDDLLPGENGEDIGQLLIDHAAGAGYSFTAANSEFKYLDLVNEGDGNAWVSTDDGVQIKIYWPLGEGVDAGAYSFYVLHFTGLHREYRGELESQIAASGVVKYDAKVEGGNVVFTLTGDKDSGSFSPFALVWERNRPGTPAVNPPRPAQETEDGVPPLLNGEEHFAYILGYEDGTVRPGGEITRAEVAAVVFRLLKEEVRDANLSTVNGFEDVSPDAWYNTAVSTLAKLGILEGRSAAAFEPDAPITRAEFAALFARFDESGTAAGSRFSDTAGHWARESIERAAALGWIDGYEDGSFRPDNCITRAEAMALINRVLEREPGSEADLLPGMRVWSDNLPGSWYYLAVQEATNSHGYTRANGPGERWTELTADPDWERYQ